LAVEFVAQAQPEGGVGQAAADGARRIVLAVQLRLGARLQDELLRQQQLVARRQA
jgi:hypothetical protein